MKRGRRGEKRKVERPIESKTLRTTELRKSGMDETQIAEKMSAELDQVIYPEQDRR